MKKSILFLAATALMAVCCNPTNDPAEPEIFGKLSYGGVEYRTLTLSNGQTWMVDPLRYVPEGQTISENPAEGKVFYPYVLTDAKITESVTYFKAADKDSVKNIKYSAAGQVVAPVKDEAGIKAQGLLYSWDLILGAAPGADYTANTAFEGVQGICPDGWHVPTETEWGALVGEDGLFYNADYKGGNLVAMNAANFLFTPSGIILSGKYNTTVIDKNNSLVFPEDPVEYTLPTTYPVASGKYYTRPNPVESSWKGYPAMTYVASSTAADPGAGKEAKQMMCAMTTFSCNSFVYHELDNTAQNQTFPEGKLNIAKANFAQGAVSVRCIKDQSAN